MSQEEQNKVTPSLAMAIEHSLKDYDPIKEEVAPLRDEVVKLRSELNALKKKEKGE